MAQSELDFLLVTKPQNIYYLSGFSGSSGILLIGQSTANLLVDFRYLKEAKEGAAGRPIHIDLVKESYLVSLAHLVGPKKRVGFEADNLSYSRFEEIKKALFRLKFVSTKGFIEDLRKVKDESEIEKISLAAAITDRVFDRLLGEISEGKSERVLADFIESQIKECGGDKAAFDVIVASGSNSASPHASVSKRVLTKGDFVKFDFGAAFCGYCSDMTRMVHLGPASSQEREVYELTRRAQEAAISSIKPGIRAQAADAIARGIITEAGFGENFAHDLGHGVGLEVHESPTLSRGGEGTLGNGMVFTIEPGIYFEGRFGVRIEDTVVLESGGVRSLNKTGKELVEL